MGRFIDEQNLLENVLATGMVSEGNMTFNEHL